MRLLNLELENWACHDFLKVTLEKGLQIEGRNGTGKSSILEAIRFIFSEQLRGHKKKIKNQRKFARVKLKIKKDHDLYVVEKILFSQKPTKARMFKNGEQIADNPSSVSQRLREEILSEELLDKLAYVPQGKLTDILERLRIKGGRQELDSLLGLDKLEKVYKGAGEELIKKREHLNLISSEMEKFPKDAEEFFSEEMGNLQGEIERMNFKIKELGEKKKSKEEKLTLLKEKIQELEKIREWKGKLEKDINKIKLELARLNEELNSAKKLLSSLKEKEEEMRKLQEEERGLKRYPEIRNLLFKKKNLEEKLKELLIEEDENKAKILRKELGEKKELFSEFKKKEIFVREREKSVAVLRENFREGMNFLESLGELEGEKKCPRCGQFLSKEHIDREKEETKKEIEKVKLKLENFEKELIQEENSLKELEREAEELKKKEAEVKHLEDSIEKRISETREIEKEIQELNKNLEEKGYLGEETFEEVEDKINNLNKILGRISQLKEDVDKGREVEEKIPQLLSSIKKLNHEKENLEHGFEKLREKFTETLYQGLKKDKEIVQEKFYKISGEIKNFEFKVKELEGKLRETDEKKKEYKEKKENFRKVKKEMRLLEQARELFHTDKGIPKYLRERYMSQLNFLLSTYFKKLNQNPLYKEVNFNKEYELELKIEDGEILTLEQISGGEKSQLAISFRLSLIDLLSPVRLLILDEPFGSLDREHREILGESMNKIAQDGGQLIVVTHIPVESLQLPERLDLGGY